jgi:hypothetical protein
MDGQSRLRAAVLEHLELLSNLELQKKYERDVTIANVPAELVCGWFDDLDLPESASGIFAGQELESVRAFSRSFEEASQTLRGLPLAELHDQPLWLEIVEKARVLRQQLRVSNREDPLQVSGDIVNTPRSGK